MYVAPKMESLSEKDDPYQGIYLSICDADTNFKTDIFPDFFFVVAIGCDSDFVLSLS